MTQALQGSKDPGADNRGSESAGGLTLDAKAMLRGYVSQVVESDLPVTIRPHEYAEQPNVPMGARCNALPSGRLSSASRC